MKVAVVFVLFFATVLCRPVRRVSFSSSESSEEVVRRPPARYMRKPVALVPRFRAAQMQNVPAVATAAESDESKESSDEVQVAAEAPSVEYKFSTFDSTTAPDTTSEDSKDSEDSDDDDDETEENDTDEDENDSNDTSESGESSTVAPSTASPVVTEEPVVETTMDPLEPTIVTDTDSGRGDSLGGYPSDYKSIIYVEDKSYHKVPSPYKSYEYYDSGKKMAYEKSDGNEVEKSMKVYKVQALQVHSDLLEEDTSTPEVESQGLDTAQDQEASPRQASVPEEGGNANDATTSESESSSATQEEEEEEEESASASVDSEDEDSQSSEEATATPGAADSDSDESDSDEDGAGPDATTDAMVVITAK